MGWMPRMGSFWMVMPSVFAPNFVYITPSMDILFPLLRRIKVSTLWTLHCWWDCKLVQPLWKSVWRFLRKLDIVLLEDTEIPLLGICPEDVPTYNKDTCSAMFIEALFIIARSWEEPRCLSTEEWIQKMWHVYTMEYYSASKNNDFMKLAGKWN